MSIGPWPPPPPDALLDGARTALWLDGTVAAATAAGWLSGHQVKWLALIPSGSPPSERGRQAAESLAHQAGVEVRPLPSGFHWSVPAGWGLAHATAVAAGATWLTLPAWHDPSNGLLPLHLHAAERALMAMGFGGIFAPLLGLEAIAVGRVAIALQVPLAQTWECDQDVACGRCEGCARRRRVWSQIGLK